MTNEQTNQQEKPNLWKRAGLYIAIPALGLWLNGGYNMFLHPVDWYNGKRQASVLDQISHNISDLKTKYPTIDDKFKAARSKPIRGLRSTGNYAAGKSRVYHPADGITVTERVIQEDFDGDGVPETYRARQGRR